eukprot:GHUV01033027.1.p2 GENE.GHUV01033027.1~~GHUV01033027.1.p2  ORF type:complete len:110 (+),score=14.01 GHUV01033027.1:64-393(+)
MALALRQSALCSSCRRARPVTRTHLGVRASITTQKIVVINSSSEDVLKAKGVRSWPTWGCEVSKFPWSYSENETCYVLKGRVFVTPDGGEPVEIKAGDMATFPAGMSCT